uniref:Uncharacterized protein n=1 Tax=Glossina brevipalpis TaxID=37001 RepID=A0A1A9WNP3_9MUSC
MKMKNEKAQTIRKKCAFDYWLSKVLWLSLSLQERREYYAAFGSIIYAIVVIVLLSTETTTLFIRGDLMLLYFSIALIFLAPIVETSSSSSSSSSPNFSSNVLVSSSLQVFYKFPYISSQKQAVYEEEESVSIELKKNKSITTHM